MSIHQLVDAFVEKINADSLHFPDYAPEVWPEQTIADCKICPAKRERYVEELESKIVHSLPKTFRSLLTRYEFPQFEVGEICFFAWNDVVRSNGNLSVVFDQKDLASELLTRGYVQIGRPYTGNYDAICFDTNKKTGDGECALVRIDHEAFFLKDKIVTEIIAPSMRQFIEQFLAENP